VRTLVLVTLATALLAVTTPLAAATNDDFTTAQNFVAGQSPVDVSLDGTTPTRYYVFRAVQGRSYCAETIPGASETAAVVTTEIDVYHEVTTSITSNTDALQEPFSGLNAGGFGLSRACWIAQVSEQTFVSVGSFGDTFTVRLRVVETTLYSNFYYAAGGYTSFTFLRNTTSTAASYTINWRSGTGSIPANSSVSGTLQPNSSAVISPPSGAVGSGIGSVEIAHNSSPDAIVATTAILAPAAGISFTAPFEKRQAW
jgi:hypothetical protein